MLVTILKILGHYESRLDIRVKDDKIYIGRYRVLALVDKDGNVIYIDDNSKLHFKDTLYFEDVKILKLVTPKYRVIKIKSLIK